MAEEGRGDFFERCPLPAAVVGGDGRVEAANRAWEPLVGWSVEELEGRPLRELLHPDDRAVAARPGGLAGSWLARAVRPDGSALRLAWAVATGPDGRHYCVARQPEAEERRLHDRFRADFINLAAHALNTPLTPLQLALDTLAVQAGSAGPEARKSLAVARRNFLRLRDVVAELLDTARIQAGRLPLDLHDADLSALAVEAAEAQRPVAAEAGVELRVEVTPGLRAVVDAGRLRQALGACVACGLGYAPPGGVVRVEAGRLGGEAALTVVAEEARLPPERRATLFQPFPVDDHPGAGLALYLARGIVELHGGQMEAGEAMDGLALRVSLPLEGPPARAATPPVDPLSAGPVVH